MNTWQKHFRESFDDNNEDHVLAGPDYGQPHGMSAWEEKDSWEFQAQRVIDLESRKDPNSTGNQNGR